MTKEEILDELGKYIMALYMTASGKPDNEYQIYKRIYTQLDDLKRKWEPQPLSNKK